MKIFTQSTLQFSSSSFTRFATALSFVFVLLFSGVIQAQTAASYSNSRTTTGSLGLDLNGNTVDMTTGTSTLVSASVDDGASAATNLGFTFVFAGTSYNQFSANSNGFCRLGGTAIAGNTRSLAVASNALITPFGEDLYMYSSVSATLRGKLIGSAPNRCYVIEWANIGIDYGSTTADGTFQLRLYEGTNRIEFVYGAMSVGDVFNILTPSGARIGFSNGTSDIRTVVTPTTYQSPTSIAAANVNNFGLGTITNLNSAADGSRVTYVFAPTTITSTAAGGNWNATSTWVGGVIPSGTAGTVANIVGPVTLSAAITNNATINVNTNGTLIVPTANAIAGTGVVNVGGTGILRIDQGGYPGGAGTNSYVYGTNATLQFNNSSGSYGVNNTDPWWPITNPTPNPTVNGPQNINVSGAGGMTLNAARIVGGLFQTSSTITNPGNLTINGTLRLNSGYGFAGTGSPIYGASSLLLYNSGGTPGRAAEWSINATGTSGTTAGYPNNVQISNATTLNYPNGSYSTNQIAGSLTIDANSNFYMDFGSPGANGALTVNGSVIANGGLSLGNQSGGDLAIRGNWTRTGTFAANGRAVTFNGAAAQTITGDTTFAFLTIANTLGGVSTANAITVANQLTLTSGIFSSSTSLSVTNNANTAISGGSSTSFVNGPLTRSLPNSSAANYVYPIGASATYLPFAITNPGGTSPVVTMQAFAASTGGSTDGTFGIASTEYWSGTFTGALSAGTVSAAKTALGSGITLIAKSSTLSGTYASLAGGTNNSIISGNNTITSATATGSSLGFFALGYTATTYYSKSTGNLDNRLNWGTATDGTGTAPTNFTAANQIFNIRNNATPTITAAWTVSGTNSKVIVGDGTNACNFTIPSGFALTGTIDVAASGILTIQNTTNPTIASLNPGSTVDFNRAGSGNQTVPAVNYGNLTISGARTGSPTITLASGTIGVSGSFLTTYTGNILVQTSGNTVNFSSASSQTIPAFVFNSITNTGNGPRTLASSGTTQIIGTLTPSTGNHTIAGSTVSFIGTTAQTIPVLPVASGANYNVLTYAGTSIGSLGGSLTAATLNINSGTIQVNNSTPYVLTVNGTTTMIGGGILDLNAGSGNSTINLKGDLTISGVNTRIRTTGSTANNGVVVFNGTTQTYTNTATGITVGYVNYAIGDGTSTTSLTLASTLSLVDDPSFPGTLTVSNNGTLVAGVNNVTSISNGGSTFILSAGGTLSTANTGGVEGVGNSSSTGTISSTNILTRTYANGANYIFNASGAQTTNFPNLNMNNLTIANTNASGVTINDATSPIVNGTLTLTSNPLRFGATSGTLTLNGPITYTSGSIVGSGAATTSVSNLTVAGTGAVTGNLTLAGNFGNFTWSRATGGTLLTSGTVNINGNWSNSAGALLNLSTNSTTFVLNFNGGQTFSGNTTFFNLTSAGTGSKNFGTTTTTIAGTLTISNGTMDTTGLNNTFIFTGASGSMAGAGGKAFNNLTISSGAITNPSGGNVTISGNYVNNGTSFIQASTLTTSFSGAGQSMTGTGATTFGSVTVQGTSTLNASLHNIGVTGTFSVSTNGTFTGGTGTGTVTFSGTTSIGTGGGTINFNNLTIGSGTLTSTTKNFNVFGTWTNNGTYTTGTETISFTGTSVQTVGGTNATTFNSVTVSGTGGGLSLGNSQTINGTLTLSATSGGNINLNGNNNVTLGGSAVLTGEICSRQFINSGSPSQGNGFVQTTRSFVSGTNYLGITIATATNLGSTNIKRFIKAVSSVGAANSIIRVYSITPTIAATGNVTLTSSYCDNSELNGNSESAPALITYYGTGTNETTGYSNFYANASNDAPNNTVTTLGTGSLIAGQNNITLANPAGNLYYTVLDGDWNIPATWVLNSVPPASVATTIKNLVTVNGTVAFAPTSVTIDPSQSLTFGSLGTITTTTITNSGTLDMTSGGTLTLNNGATIANGSSTFTGGTGTVVASGTLALTGTTISFNNLTLNGTLTNSATTTNIKSTLRLNQGSSVSGNAVVYDSGAASTVSYSGTSTQTATSLDFPSSSGPTNVIVNNAGGFRLPFSRTVSGNFTVTSGDVQNLTGTGVTLTMTGAAAGLVVNGSITGTDVGGGNDINLIYNVSGTLTVSGSGSLSRFLNVTVGSSSTLALARTLQVMYGTFAVNGILRIDAGGAVSSVTNCVAPIYGGSSSLVYNSATTYNRFYEWSASGTGTIGTTPGYPNNVTVQGGTTLNLSNSDNTNRALAGNLTLGTGNTSNGSLTMESMTGKLTVNGSVIIGGNSVSGASVLTFSTNAASAGIEVVGNWTRNQFGSFNDNGRATFFIGSGNSTITTNNPAQYTFLFVNKSSGGSVSLANAINVSNTLSIANGAILNLGAFASTAANLTTNGNVRTTGTSYGGGANSPATIADATFFSNTSGYLNVGTCGTYSLISIAAAAAVCVGNTATINVTSTAVNLPNGNYTVFYTLGAPNAGTGNASMTVSGGTGSGSFTTSALATSGATNITINFIRFGCVSAISSGNSASITLDSTTSSDGGVSWTNGTPTSTKSVIYDGPTAVTVGTNLSACSLRLINNAVVTVSSGFNVTLEGKLTVDSGSTFTLNNNANLLQNVNDITNSNSGNIVVRRNSSALKRFDYTLWSSPVSGSQTLLNFSPLTNTGRFYTYKTIGAGAPADPPNIYVSVVPSTTTFASAKGYLIRMPFDHPTAATIWSNGSFTGIPNNGTIPYTMDNGIAGQRFNLVGNPYPSPISMSQFVTDNTTNITGTLYFWRESNNNTSNNAYCTWSPGGPTGTFVSNNEAQVVNPNGIIRTGQGFFVEVKPSNVSNILNFKNTQRSSNTSDQFFRTTNNTVVNDIETNRFWLNLTNATGEFSQMAAGYMTDATNGVDIYDGRNINTGNVLLNSILNNEDYTIQGKALPFTSTDVIPLSMKITTAGQYTITIDHVDGLFTGGAQAIYLKDNLTATEHNLQTGAYNFASDAGTFTNRFEIIYQSQLGVGNPTFNENTVIIYNQNNNFVVNTGNVIMASIKVFDIRGRLLQEKKGINASQTTIGSGLANQVLLVQITSEEGAVVTKKVVR